MVHGGGFRALDRFFLRLPEGHGVRLLEGVAIAVSVLILVAAAWFWFEQVLAARALLDTMTG